jgi:hypothetical protein
MTVQEKVFKLFEAIQTAEQEDGVSVALTRDDLDILTHSRAWLLIRMQAALILRVAYQSLEDKDCSHDHAQFIRGHIRSLRWLLEGATESMIPVDLDSSETDMVVQSNDLESLARSILDG